MSWPDIGSIVSPRLAVRPVAARDLDDLMRVNGDPEVTRFLPYATWQTAEDGQAWLSRMQFLSEGGASRQLVVQRRDSGRVIGTVLLFRHDAGSARAELGYTLARDHWRQGWMREALQAVCAHAFGPLGLRRLEAEVNPDNTASATLLQALGFTLEGRLRQRWVGKTGSAYDTHFYGCLASEWAAHTGAPAAGAADQRTEHTG